MEPGESDNPNGVFAYSQLTASSHSPQDPDFPAGGDASYEGATIAWDESNNYYEGSITIDVTWAANVGTGTTSSNVGTVTAVIDNLRSNGALYTNGTAIGAVDTIIFTPTSRQPSRASPIREPEGGGRVGESQTVDVLAQPRSTQETIRFRGSRLYKSNCSSP